MASAPEWDRGLAVGLDLGVGIGVEVGDAVAVAVGVAVGVAGRPGRWRRRSALGRCEDVEPAPAMTRCLADLRRRIESKRSAPPSYSMLHGSP
jgi:hypothetical protein